MNQYEIEEVLAIVNKAFKSKLKADGINSSVLKKIPNSYGEYKSDIGGIKFEMRFYSTYLRVEITEDAYRYRENKYAHFFEYVKEVGKACNKYFVQIAFYRSPLNTNHDEMRNQIFHLSKSLGFTNEYDRETYRKLPAYTDDVICDRFDGLLINNLWIIGELASALTLEKEEYPALSFETKESSESMFAFHFYYKGYEGDIELVAEENSVYLIEKNLDLKQLVMDKEDIPGMVKTILESGSEHIRLKNLIEPNRKNFDERMQKEYGIEEKMSKTMFKYLMEKYDPIEIEERILSEKIEVVKYKKVEVTMLNIFDAIFVVNTHYNSKRTECFNITGRDKAVTCFEQQVLMRMMDEINYQVESFDKEIQIRIENNSK